jgi:hypothetical protein
MKQYLGLEDEDRCLGFFMLATSNKISTYRSGREPLDSKLRWVDSKEGAVSW